ncbi:MAG: hypothetical protein WB778_08755 [Thermoplasmata archaeon]
MLDQSAVLHRPPAPNQRFQPREIGFAAGAEVSGGVGDGSGELVTVTPHLLAAEERVG